MATGDAVTFRSNTEWPMTTDEPDEPPRLFVPADERPPGYKSADEIPTESADDNVLIALDSFLGSGGGLLATFNFGWICYAIAQEEEPGSIQACCVAAGAIELARPKLTVEEEILADQLLTELHPLPGMYADEDDE
jgi:hypothetical protein